MDRELLITADFAATRNLPMDLSSHIQATRDARVETDKSIVLKVQAGQTENFVHLYDAYLDKIYRFLYFRTSHQETAEDLTSQTFLKALDKIKSFDAEKGTFQAWLYRIAHNLLIDHYRSPRKEVDLDHALNISSDSSPEQDTENVLATEATRKLLDTLPADTQTLVILRIWDELSYAEIAKIMDKSEASLKMQFSRAINVLRSSPLLPLLIIFVTQVTQNRMWS